jgi:hypothetical protein
MTVEFSSCWRTYNLRGNGVYKLFSAETKPTFIQLQGFRDLHVHGSNQHGNIRTQVSSEKYVQLCRPRADPLVQEGTVSPVPSCVRMTSHAVGTDIRNEYYARHSEAQVCMNFLPAIEYTSRSMHAT